MRLIYILLSSLLYANAYGISFGNPRPTPWSQNKAHLAAYSYSTLGNRGNNKFGPPLHTIRSPKVEYGFKPIDSAEIRNIYNSPSSSSYSTSSVSYGPPPPTDSYEVVQNEPISSEYGLPSKEAPSNSYGPPSKVVSETYGPPTNTVSDSYAPPPKPNNNYGPPSKPNDSYGPPSKVITTTYVTPSKPSDSYGPPTNTVSDSYSPPSKPNNNYGPPSKPIDSYGPPSKPIENYGPPSSESYGPPSEEWHEGYAPAPQPTSEIKFIIYKPENEEIIKEELIHKGQEHGNKVSFIYGPNLEINHKQKVYLPPPKKSIIYILLKEPVINTQVQVMGSTEGEKSKPEVFIIYETKDGVIRKHYDLTEDESKKVVSALGERVARRIRGSDEKFTTEKSEESSTIGSEELGTTTSRE